MKVEVTSEVSCLFSVSCKHWTMYTSRSFCLLVSFVKWCMNVIALRGVSCSRRRLRRNAQVRSNVKMVIWGSETSAPSGWEKFRYEATKESTKHTKKTNKTPRNINPKLKITPLPIFFGGLEHVQKMTDMTIVAPNPSPSPPASAAP